MGMENIEHLVVVMFENRSFDNLLGWLYDNQTNPPKFNIPPQSPPTFDGLIANTYYNLIAPSSPDKVFASRPGTPWPSCPNPNQIPTPDPNEEFDNVTFQIFGTSSPQSTDAANMSGFLQDYSTTDAGVASANQIMQSLANVRSRFESIQHDSGIKAAFKFLVALSISTTTRSQKTPPYGLQLSSTLSPLALAKVLHRWVSGNRDSLEYAQLAQGAASDAIANWYSEHSNQRSLFQGEGEQKEIWNKAATGAGFCELSRLFFAKFTERYLNYFLEREASAASTM